MKLLIGFNKPLNQSGFINIHIKSSLKALEDESEQEAHGTSKNLGMSL